MNAEFNLTTMLGLYGELRQVQINAGFDLTTILCRFKFPCEDSRWNFLEAVSEKFSA